ncbi:MAG: hypothetical protein QXS70_01245 [Desulfurococcaceae archaeon]
MSSRSYLGNYGFFYSYLLTPTEILVLKISSSKLFTILTIICFALIFFSPLLSILLLIAVVVFHWRKARSIRGKLKWGYVESVSSRIVERVPYTSVKKYKIVAKKRPELYILYDNKVIGMNFSDTGYEELREFLSSKISPEALVS